MTEDQNQIKCGGCRMILYSWCIIQDSKGWDCPVCLTNNSHITVKPFHFSFNEYGQRAHALAIYPKDKPDYLYFKLAGEVGEILDKKGKLLRDGWPGLEDGQIVSQKEISAWSTSILKELGDVLWYLNEIVISQFHSTLAEVALLNLAKLESRAARGTLKGSGDDR